MLSRIFNHSVASNVTAFIFLDLFRLSQTNRKFKIGVADLVGKFGRLATYPQEKEHQHNITNDLCKSLHLMTFAARQQNYSPLPQLINLGLWCGISAGRNCLLWGAQRPLNTRLFDHAVSALRHQADHLFTLADLLQLDPLTVIGISARNNFLPGVELGLRKVTKTIANYKKLVQLLVASGNTDAFFLFREQLWNPRGNDTWKSLLRATVATLGYSIQPWWCGRMTNEMAEQFLEADDTEMIFAHACCVEYIRCHNTVMLTMAALNAKAHGKFKFWRQRIQDALVEDPSILVNVAPDKTLLFLQFLSAVIDGGMPRSVLLNLAGKPNASPELVEWVGDLIQKRDSLKRQQWRRRINHGKRHTINKKRSRDGNIDESITGAFKKLRLV